MYKNKKSSLPVGVKQIDITTMHKHIMAYTLTIVVILSGAIILTSYI